MPSALSLRARRYRVLDSISIAFRCAPLAAFFYGFFDLASAALTPITTLVAAQLIDAVVRTMSAGAPVGDIYVQLALLSSLTAFHWLRGSLHHIADLRLTLALRARYRTALTEKRTRLEYGQLEQTEVWDLIQRVAANPEGGRLKITYYHLVDMTSFVIKVVGLLVILASAVWWAPLVVIAVAGLREGVPSILIPHAADQPFWGSRVSAIGAGPEPISVKAVSVETLVAAIHQAGSDSIRKRANEVGNQIQSENGIAAAISVMEKHANAYHRSG